MAKKRVLLVTRHPLLRESVRSLSMPHVEVVMAERLPTGEEATTTASVWIVDCDLIPEKARITDLFPSVGPVEQVILVSLDRPDIIVMRRYSLEGVDAATFLEDIILASDSR